MSFVQPRRKRRPALACEECRRRKIRCNRQSPCTPCIKANLPNCLYVRDDRDQLSEVPFEPEETQFSVFEQTLVGLVPWPPVTPTASTAPVTQTQMNIRQHHETFDGGFQHFHRQSDSLSLDLSLDISSGDIPSSDPSYFDMPVDDPSNWETEASPKEPHEIMALYPSLTFAPVGFCYKGRYLAQSHWINYAHQSSEIIALIQSHETNRSNQGHWTFQKCKTIRQAIKARESTTANRPPTPLGSMVPVKAISDKLVQAYLRTFQAVLTILHVPTFLRDYSTYWKSPSSSNQSFTIVLLLVLSIGSCFYSKEPGLSRILTLQWIKAASNWLLSSKPRSKLCLDGLRIQCLFLLAEQVHGLRSGSPCLCTGTIYRAALYSDLYIGGNGNVDDPRDRLKTETHWRLWTTIVEMDLQASMDWGSPPIVSIEDINYPLPSNMEDASLDLEDAPRDATTPQPTPLDNFTQSSLQILLAKTQPVRLKIARFLNNKRSEYSFDAALSLSAQLLEEFKKCHDLIEGYRMASTPPTAFQTQLFDLLMRRFILSLHHPFALKAMSDPRYAYSRQICIDTSMALLTHLSQSNDSDVRQLQLKGTGVFYDVYLQSCLCLLSETTNQIDTDTCFLSTSRRSNSARREMKEVIEKFSRLAADRIAAGETNIKRYLLVSCLVAQADAKQESTLVQISVSKTLEKVLEQCGLLFQSQLRALTDPTSMDRIANRNGTNQHHWPQWDEFWGPNRPSSQIFGNPA